MKFKSARAIEQMVWTMRLADYPRSLNRARIASLANGAPPYPDEEAQKNGIEINVNDLSLTRIAHDARMQLYGAFNKPGNFFTAKLDRGSVHKRHQHSLVVTKEITKRMKRSDAYYHAMLSKFAMLVLHGIGPAHWVGEDPWCPRPAEIGDVLVPSKTLTSLENLPFFAIGRQYTPYELQKQIDKEANPGWNKKVAQAAIDWADEETARMHGGTEWQEYWSPEKRTERYKEDSGVYAGDLVRTIDCWDFYYLSDEGNHEGWRRRIVLDAEGGFSAWSARNGKNMPSKNLIGGTDQFLYDSGTRSVASNINEIINFQFADLSAVAPFRYHSVRSLGFLLYSACHLHNRLRCAFSEAVFENLMMFMRVKSLDDAERALHVQFANRGVVDDSIQFLSPAERWQPNAQFAQLGLAEYKQVINENSASYVQNAALGQGNVEKTKFQVMAEVTAMQTLISAALQQAYRFQTTEYREIFRRFMRPASTDADARSFRDACLKQGVPESFMNAECWDIEPERILGGGNKTLELAIASQLYEMRGSYNPAAQQKILRNITLSVTDDPAMAEDLVPFEAPVTNSRTNAQVAFGSVMAGSMVEFGDETNYLETATVFLTELTLNVQAELQSGQNPSEDRVRGFQNVLVHASILIGQIAQDASMQQVAGELAQQSGKLANEVRGMQKRIEQAKEAESKQGGMNEDMLKVMSKIQADKIMAEAKAQNSRESHATRTAQRIAQDELHRQQQMQDHQQQMRMQADKNTLELQKEANKIALDKVKGALEMSQTSQSGES